MLLVPNVYAGGPRADYDEAYQDIEGAPECWVDGYDAGFAGVYDRQRANECSKIPGDQYNVSWKWGCEGGGFDEYRCKNIKKYSDVRIDHEILQNANMVNAGLMGLVMDRKTTHTILKDLAVAASTAVCINTDL